MKKLLIFLVLGISSAGVYAQDNVTVNGTIVDSDVITWLNGSWNAQLRNPQGGVAKYIDTGLAVTVSFSGGLDGTGSFSQLVANNSAITPAGTFWIFSFCPYSSFQCSELPALTITANLNISSQATTYIRPPRFAAQVGAYGYNDVEITPVPNPGGSYYNVTSLCVRVWSGSSFSCVGTGGGGGTSVTVNGGATLVTANLANNTGAGEVDFTNPSGSTVNAAVHNTSTTVNGTTCTLGSTCTPTASTPNSLTMNNSGTGGSSPQTFNGGAAITMSYNTIGAPGLTASNTYTGATTNDYSATSQFKLPVAAAYAPAANGELGYASTNANWEAWSNGVTNILALVPTATTVNNLDCVNWSKVGSTIVLGDAGAACGSGGGSSAWSALTNPTANLTLSMGGDTSTFNYTSALANAFLWANTTAATVSASASSPTVALCGNSWTGASSQDCITMQQVPGTGVNAAITTQFAHTGSSTGIDTSAFPGPLQAGLTSSAGMISLPGNTGAISLVSNNINLIGPNAASFTAYGLQFSSTGPTVPSVMTSGTPASNVSQVTYTTLAGTGAGIPTGPTSSTSGDLVDYTGTVGQQADSGILATNVVTAASNAGAANQVWTSGGANKTAVAIDFPDFKNIPAANCNNTSAGNGWSIGSGGTVTCRAGTNNLGGYIAITDTAATFAQFAIVLPEDWDTGTNPYIRFQLAYPGTDGASAHTIIPNFQTSCAKGDGSTSDDVTFNAAHSSSTITLSSATANLFFSTSNIQLNSTDVTGCVAGSMLIIKVGRATDTATSAANFYSATITIPRKIVVQAN